MGQEVVQNGHLVHNDVNAEQWHKKHGLDRTLEVALGSLWVVERDKKPHSAIDETLEGDHGVLGGVHGLFKVYHVLDMGKKYPAL